MTGPAPNFDAPLKVGRLDWVPGKTLSADCQVAKEKWEKQAEAHEMRHVSDIQGIVDSFNKAWKTKIVTAVGATEREAGVNLSAQLKTMASSDATKIKQQCDSAGVTRHMTDKVDPMDCESCPSTSETSSP